MGELRPYQRDFCDAVINDLGEHDRLLGVMATGAGKTVAAAEKIAAWTGTIPDVETGESYACGSSQIVVGTTQSISGRLFKYYPEDISLIIVDEAHRNTLARGL